MARGLRLDELVNYGLLAGGGYFGYHLALSGALGLAAQKGAIDIQGSLHGASAAATAAAKAAAEEAYYQQHPDKRPASTGSGNVVTATHRDTGPGAHVDATAGAFSPTNPTGGQQTTPAATNSPGTSASAWEAFHAELWPGAPAAYANQVWAHNATLQQWRYVNDPGQFGQYGIAQDASNVKYASWGHERAFRANGNASEATATWFGRSDSSTGLNAALTDQGQSPPAEAISGLRQAVQSGAWVPAGALGWEVLKLYGIV